MRPTFLLTVLAFSAGCGSAGDDKSTGDTGTEPTAETGTTPTAETGTTPTDTGPQTTPPEPPDCLQETAVYTGQVQFVEDDVTLDAATLAVTTAAPTPKAALPKGLDDAAFHGALDPASGEAPWWQGWTYVDPSVDGGLPGAGFHPLATAIGAGTVQGGALNSCGTIDKSYVDAGSKSLFGESFPVCVVSGRITASVEWPNTHMFLLTDDVVVGDGDAQLSGGSPSRVTLTIQPGTQVYAAEGLTSLVISRGSRLDAQGSAGLPIIFSSVSGGVKGIIGNPVDLTQRGAWGGVVLSGMASTNSGNADSELLSSWLPDGEERWFGGTNDADGSGTIRHVIIAEAGFSFRQNTRLPGLGLEAVGSGTVIDHVQVFGAAGDGIAMLGGTVDLRHVVVNGASDDHLDLDLGYRGTLQYGIVRFGADNGLLGIESDSRDDQSDTPPRTAATFANFTFVGATGTTGGRRTPPSTGALHRQGAADRVYRSVFTDDTLEGDAFAGGCLDVDDAVEKGLEYRDVIFDCSPTPLAACEFGEDP